VARGHGVLPHNSQPPFFLLVAWEVIKFWPHYYVLIYSRPSGLLSPTKKTVIVDVVIVDSVMWAEGWERGERGKSQGWSSCYQTGDQGGWKFVTMSKKLALQVSRGFLIVFARCAIKLLVHYVDTEYLNIWALCKYK
jgi:hypothetical protein